jgi:hypothetical protein
MEKIKLVTLLVFLLALTGCGDDGETIEKNKNGKSKTLLEKGLSTQLDALEKSKQVEQELSDAVEKRREEMRDQGI